MNIRVKINTQLAMKVLVCLLVINYMIVTIIFDDFIILKYSRDVILILMFITSLGRWKLDGVDIGWLFFGGILLFSFVRSDNISLSIISLRRYCFPILAFWSIKRMKTLSCTDMQRWYKFLLLFFAIVSTWGVFQAWILKDTFLKNLGYPTIFAYGYGREMLNYSFYFGGLGIQRVVSTLSNSNVCGLILGTTMILLIMLYPYINYRHKNVCIILMLIGYILTFSRSNFLALLIVGIVFIYRYLPYKKYIWLCLGVGIFCAIILLLIQGQESLIYKLINWVVNSLSLKEESVAGRASRWSAALETVRNNPFGIGFGHVGSLAINAKVANALDCENSYLAIAIDNGILGLIVYILNVIGVFFRFESYQDNYDKTQKDMKRICIAGKSILVYLSIVMFFSNHIYDMEAVTIIYIYEGFLLNMLKKDRECYQLLQE